MQLLVANYQLLIPEMSKRYEARITDLIRRHVTELVERELKDPRVEGVTITDVEVSPDTRFAKVFYSLIGDDAKKEEVAEGLRSAQGWVTHELGQRLRTRNTPHITFEFDPSLEYGDRMSRLLDDLKKQQDG